MRSEGTVVTISLRDVDGQVFLVAATPYMDLHVFASCESIHQCKATVHVRVCSQQMPVIRIWALGAAPCEGGFVSLLVVGVHNEGWPGGAHLAFMTFRNAELQPRMIPEVEVHVFD